MRCIIGGEKQITMHTLVDKFGESYRWNTGGGRLYRSGFSQLEKGLQFFVAVYVLSLIHI